MATTETGQARRELTREQRQQKRDKAHDTMLEQAKVLFGTGGYTLIPTDIPGRYIVQGPEEFNPKTEQVESTCYCVQLEWMLSGQIQGATCDCPHYGGYGFCKHQEGVRLQIVLARAILALAECPHTKERAQMPDRAQVVDTAPLPPVVREEAGRIRSIHRTCRRCGNHYADDGDHTCPRCGAMALIRQQSAESRYYNGQ